MFLFFTPWKQQKIWCKIISVGINGNIVQKWDKLWDKLWEQLRRNIENIDKLCDINFENNFEENFMNRSTYKMASPQWLPKQKNQTRYLSNDCRAQNIHHISDQQSKQSYVYFITAIAILGLRGQQVVHPYQRLFRILTNIEDANYIWKMLHWLDSEYNPASPSILVLMEIIRTDKLNLVLFRSSRRRWSVRRRRWP